MKTLIIYFKGIGYELKRSYIGDNGQGSIYFEKLFGEQTIYLTITKDYTGYKIKKAEFIGESFGKEIRFETKLVSVIKQSILK